MSAALVDPNPATFAVTVSPMPSASAVLVTVEAHSAPGFITVMDDGRAGGQSLPEQYQAGLRIEQGNKLTVVCRMRAVGRAKNEEG